MISTRRRLLMFVVTMSAVGTVSACGGGSSPASTGSGPGSGSTASATTTASALAAGSAQQFCGVVRQQETLLQGTGLVGLLSGGTPAAWKAYLDQTAATNQQLVNAAPPDIQANVKTLQDATLALQTTLAAANYDVSKVGSAKLIQLMQTPDRTAATTSLVAYVKTNCGIDLTTPAG